jgi:hypothetical protein
MGQLKPQHLRHEERELARQDQYALDEHQLIQVLQPTHLCRIAKDQME